jgi:hypothetical protein
MGFGSEREFAHKSDELRGEEYWKYGALLQKKMC